MRLYPVGKYILALNDDHKLPDVHREHPLYDRIHMIVASEVLRLVDGCIIDIGANVGDTAAGISSVSDKKIVCFEGEPSYYEYLLHNVAQMGDQVIVCPYFIETPEFQGANYVYQADTGTGKFKDVNEGGGLVKYNFLPLEAALEQYCSGESIALFKTDTDGYDLAILSEFIKTRNAILFFEFDVMMTIGHKRFERWMSFFDTLTERKYSAVFFDNFGVPVLIADGNLTQVAGNLHRYCHAQQALRTNRMHYNDVWAFPSDLRHVFNRVVEILHCTVLGSHGV